MSDQLSVVGGQLPVRCGCGGEAVANDYIDRYENKTEYFVHCVKCGICSADYDTEAEAITAWNRAMGKRTVKVELNPLAEDIVIGNTTFKIGTHVIAECECGTWLRLGYKYCPNCGARLEWDE